MKRWPRFLELVLAVWFTAGLPLFSTEPGTGTAGVASVGASVMLLILAVFSLKFPVCRYHLIGLVPAAGMMWMVFQHPETPPPPEFQHLLACALVWLVTAILPTESASPPEEWREHLRDRRPEE